MAAEKRISCVPLIYTQGTDYAAAMLIALVMKGSLEKFVNAGPMRSAGIL